MTSPFPPGLLPDGLRQRVDAFYRDRPFTLFWEVRTLLYLGIVSLSTGLGILIYRNIDSIGHQTILALMMLASFGCFWYCAKRSPPFTRGAPSQATSVELRSNSKARSQTMQSSWADYMLLLGVLLFGGFTGYLQFKYSVFGTRYALALLLPASFYLFLAYRFDHRGVLQLALSGFCAAAGVATTPLAAFRENMFSHTTPVVTGLVMGGLLVLAGALSDRLDCKRHFAFGYINFGMHLAMVSAFIGMVLGESAAKWLYALLLSAFTAAIWVHARRTHSPYFLLMAVLYGYVAFTYIVMHFLLGSLSSSDISVIFLYFILSCIGTIYLFLNLKTLAGKDDAGLPQK
jgi:hypothetical protein